jgi:hypothetical protein
MKSELWAWVFLLPACSSQVSLGGQDDSKHAVSPQPEASVSTMDASAPIEAAVEAHAPSGDGSAFDAPLVGDEHHAADGSPDAAAYDPCAGKACGVACTVCSPHDVQCVEPPGSKQCSPHQQCVTAPLCP